jgi:hypothetical protein
MITKSKMTGKLKGICGYSTNPLNNDFCQSMSKNNKCICSKCYSQTMLRTMRKNCVPCFTKNGIEWSNTLITINDIDKPDKDYIRINPHGEILNELHATNILRLCTFYPNHTITLFTKRLNLINTAIESLGYKPKNLIIVYSNPYTDKPIQTKPTNTLFRFVDKIFNVVSTDKNHKINCGAKSCATCLNCYDKNKENILIELLK